MRGLSRPLYNSFRIVLDVCHKFVNNVGRDCRRLILLAFSGTNWRVFFCRLLSKTGQTGGHQVSSRLSHAKTKTAHLEISNSIQTAQLGFAAVQTSILLRWSGLKYACSLSFCGRFKIIFSSTWQMKRYSHCISRYTCHRFIYFKYYINKVKQLYVDIYSFLY